jgi:hypothetical protein
MMGIADILAGAVILIGFSEHLVAILFGLAMIIKGGVSFI